MTLGGFIVLMVLSTASAWAAWFMVLFKINPFVAGPLGFALFYISLWLSLTGSICLLGLLVRIFLRREELIFRHVGNSFRQAMFLSLLLVALLFFQGQRLLTWWNVLLLILGAVMLEVFALTYAGRRRVQER